MKGKDIETWTEAFGKVWRNYINKLLENNEELQKIKIETEQGGITDKIPDAFTEPTQPKSDNINHPTHYNQGGIETLDYIKAKAPHYESYAIGNIIKYVSRYQHKNGLEDLKKAQFYLNDLVKEMEKNVQK